ncbi:MAG: hypothetical protein HY825_19025 [Acidobacteria bacterium]|nr:hypothetical protein [Acidobacteriota bacterium]
MTTSRTKGPKAPPDRGGREASRVGKLLAELYATEDAALGSFRDRRCPGAGDGGTFQSPPKNEARVRQGGACVFVDGKPVVRSGDTAFTCGDPEDAPTGTVVAVGTVFAGS